MTRRKFLRIGGYSSLGTIALSKIAGCQSKPSIQEQIGSFRDIKGIQVSAAIPISHLSASWEYSADRPTIQRAQRFLKLLDGLGTVNEAKSYRLFIPENPFLETCKFMSQLNEGNQRYSLNAHGLVWDNLGVISGSEPRMREVKNIGTPQERQQYVLNYALRALEKILSCKSVKSVDILNEILVLHGEEIPFGHKGIPIRGFDNGDGLIPDIETVALIYKTAKEKYPETEFILNFANTLFKNHRGAEIKRKYVIETLKKLQDLGGAPDIVGLQAHFLMTIKEAIQQVDESTIRNFIQEIRDLGFKVKITEFDFLSIDINKSVKFINKFLKALREIEGFEFWGFETQAGGFLSKQFRKVYGRQKNGLNLALPGDAFNHPDFRYLYNTTDEFTEKNPLYKAYYLGLTLASSKS
ncbi:MAG: endo-1,4-beta-xylanase [Candidatus Caenarcaniphilales bacterium]|nr:endo-1,4-beta-xylanase [Candidatus Caenarcaniphilales bacterium]